MFPNLDWFSAHLQHDVHRNVHPLFVGRVFAVTGLRYNIIEQQRQDNKIIRPANQLYRTEDRPFCSLLIDDRC